MIAPYVPFVMAAVLVAAMLIELRSGRIPNWLTLVPFVLFIALAATSPDRSALVWQLVLAVAVFAVGIVLFITAGIGAGAVKLAAGTALFVPLSSGFAALGIFAAALFIGVFLIIQLRRAFGSDSSKWHVMTKNVMPMSVPIGLMGLSALFWL